MRAATAFHGAGSAALGVMLCAGAIASDSDATLLDETAFRALVEGRTVHYTLDGEFYGSESFPGGEQAIWRDPGGACEEGVWRAYGLDLCFRYDRVSCWRVYETPDGARYAESVSGLRVDFHSVDEEPLQCGGAPLS